MFPGAPSRVPRAGIPAAASVPRAMPPCHPAACRLPPAASRQPPAARGGRQAASAPLKGVGAACGPGRGLLGRSPPRGPSPPHGHGPRRPLGVAGRARRGQPAPRRTPNERPTEALRRPPDALHSPSGRPPQPLRTPSRRLPRPLSAVRRRTAASYCGLGCSNIWRRYGRPPQIRRLSRVHTLGTGKLSRSCPQPRLVEDHRPRSAPCGFVDERSPQPVDDGMVHRARRTLSTGGPQAGAACPQRSAASPHGCPLFGNATRRLTVPSERRHTKLPD